VGTKKKQSSFICSKFPKVITNYHELFLGGASVLLELLLEVKLGRIILLGKAFVSDLNSFLINFYKVVQDHVLEFLRFSNKIIYLYNKLTDIESKSNLYYKIRCKFNFERSPIKSAVFFYFLNKSCFRGLYRSNKKGEFNVPFGNYPVINFHYNIFIEFSMLVQDVVFNCSHYSDFFFDITEKDVVYLDPPYVGKNIFNAYLKEDFNHLEFFKFIKKLERNNLNYLLSNILDKKLLEFFFGEKYQIFFLELREGMTNVKKKRKEILILFLVDNFR
jgi:DNA adenine methylase